MHLSFSPLFSLALMALVCTACEPAFVYHPLSSSATTLTQQQLVEKKIAGENDGRIRICFGDEDSWQTVEEAAAESCARLGLRAQWRATNRWQCRWTVPHQAVFQCVFVAKDGTVTVPSHYSVYAPAQAEMEQKRLQSLDIGKDTADGPSVQP